MTKLPPLNIDPLPGIDLRHLFVLTDDTGILQHATRATPDLHHGYCTDDNARALIAAVKIWALPGELWAPSQSDEPTASGLLVATQRYLAFLAYAFNAQTGRFRNFMQYDRSWLEEVGSEDSHARTVWALGKAYRLAPNDDTRELANDLMAKAIPAIEEFDHLKPRAYALLGLEEYLRERPGELLAGHLHTRICEHLFDVWKANAKPDWPWWEDWLTWGNAKLPHAMLVAGRAMKNDEAVDASLKALRWLLDMQRGEDGRLSIIGNDGWCFRGQNRAKYDQQPIEAKALVQACLAAAETTGETFWADEAVRCFRWFLGFNDAEEALYNSYTGGGHDGLHVEGVNANQGAESTLAYLISVLEMHLYEQARTAK